LGFPWVSPLGNGIGILRLAGKALFDQFENFKFAPWRIEHKIAPCLELKNLKRISGNAPIRLLTQSAFNQQWAVFFMQDYDLEISQRLGYLRGIRQGLRKISADQEKGCFFLSDGKIKEAIWHNEVFSLQSHLDRLELLEIDAPNGVETVQGDSFVWLNNHTVISDHPGQNT
jgi:hypothetical protein